MGLFTDGFKLLKKASEPLYKTPKSIQETIEIMAVAENGIFEVSRNKYSKCYRFQDINYTTATEDEQIGIFERYCKFLNSLDCNYKITINNKNKNMEDLRDKVLITEKNDGFNNYRRIYNDIIEEKIIEGRQGIEQERYLTITIERKNFEEAKAQFATLEATIHKAFIELGAEIVPLNGNERLKVLYDYYHLGDEGSFDFDIKKAKKVGADFKNDLCNGMVKYFPDHFEDESKYCKALFIKKYPSSLSDRFINEITSLPVHSITSIDVVPVPKDLTTKVLQKKYLGIESDIIKQQRVRNKNNDFSTENGTVIDADGDYSTEMVSPKLEYSEMGKLQEVVRCVKNAGAFVNSSCGMHVHVDASNHTPRSLKNALTIMYCKEDILFKALNVQTRREDEYCQKVRPMVLEKIRRMPNSTITMEKFKRAWYEGNDGSSEHYNWTRYYALNLHAVFSKGTLEWRCFESTLHAGKVRSNITLALAISAQAINQSCTHAKKTEIGDNPAFTFRTFLLRLGLIGDEYKNVRKHLLANLDGDKAWRYDKSTYACLQNPRRTDDAR